MPRLAALLRAALVLLLPAVARAEVPLDFEKDVRPIFEQSCIRCHGPEQQKSGLRLDVKASALKGGDSGEPAIVPGSPHKSNLLKVIVTHDPEQAMPPKGERLKPEQIAILEKWVETGAHWTEAAKTPDVITPIVEREITADDRRFWSFIPPRVPELPAVKNTSWPRDRIDQFVLAKQEARGLRPSPEASPTVLIRRVTYDLTGLPPTPEEVDTFLADQSPSAYEHLVDRLLASPRFGERMASLWLPLARYAEDQAHQVGSDTKFFYPNAYKYRAWVIGAFNRDVPYDRFITLQLAADKVDDAEPEDQAALGFLGLGPKYYNRNRLDVMADEWEDRVDTVCRTTLGLTVACARCHDHKFDPINQSDYYALAGVFASTKMVNKTPEGKVQKDGKSEEVNAAVMHVVEDGEAQDLNVFIRGNVQRKGPVAKRRFLTVLSNGTPAPFKEGSGRKELAAAIVDRSNPLTARVMVNRLWGMLTGSPIVASPSNFGHSGVAPSDQPLLDELAVRFMAEGWSVKRLVRDVVLSAAYRQSAAADPQFAKRDAANETLWHMNRRRLTVEQWRDGVLFVTGELAFDGSKSTDLDDLKNHQRTVFARISRLKLNDLLMQFDYPDPNVHAEKRSVTTTPMQKLFALNSPFMIAQAKALAGRLDVDAGGSGDDAAKIERAYRLIFSRGPTADETKLAEEFLQGRPASGMTRWDEYAQILLACNEALYVD